MNDDQKRALTAVMLSGLILFVWQSYFAPKFAPVTIPKENFATTQTPSSQVSSSSAAENKDNTAEAESTQSQYQVEHIQVRNGEGFLELDSNFEIENIDSINNKFTFEATVGNNVPARIEVYTDKGWKKIPFHLISNGSKFEGRSNEFGINVNGEINEEGVVSYNLSSETARKYRWVFNSEKKELGNRRIREFLVYDQDVNRFKLDDEKHGEGMCRWFGIDFNYHFFSFSLDEKLSCSYKANGKGQLTVETNEFVNKIDGKILFTLKNYDYLSQLGNNLHLSVDFGILGVLAVPILKSLQFFYKYLPNYGVAIILLTLLLRLITFPLQYKSFKSMKKMQVIQPELTKIREKFKEDPARLQKESMELFKRAGANPLSGCLPLILQMPIFFAFYQVLYSAVELVGAPFGGWIGDLSVKDPFYILPVIMTIAMFLQQKITPSTTADPTQKKVMMFMPLIFGLIMKDLPSGLTLYILVSTVFGMIQQLWVYKLT